VTVRLSITHSYDDNDQRYYVVNNVQELAVQHTIPFRSSVIRYLNVRLKLVTVSRQVGEARRPARDIQAGRSVTTEPRQAKAKYAR